jgi:hypothetical protein
VTVSLADASGLGRITNVLSFDPGETSKTVSVTVTSDTTSKEPRPSWSSSPHRSELAGRGSGLGRITNDD